MSEARLEHVSDGLAPQSDGWFVLSAADAQWLRHPHFGLRCTFEATGSVIRQRDDLEQVAFPQLGVNLMVLEKGKPSGLYHREDQQEDFLVLRGACLLQVEGEERPLRQWDLFHSAPGTEHVLVGTTDEPCIVLAVGARLGYPGRFYPREGTASPHEAYAPHGHWQPGPKPPGVL